MNSNRTNSTLALLQILPVAALLVLPRQPLQAGNWPQWRGPDGDSTSEETGLPVQWSETAGVLWKLKIPEWGTSTPAIWDDAIFITSQEGDDLLLLKISGKTGKILWTRKVGTGKVVHELRGSRKRGERGIMKFHRDHNLASPSPVTDGERVIVHYGNGLLASYDFDGNRRWERNLQKDHGTYTIWWGHANSPVLHGDLVISACMQDSLVDLGRERAPSYLVAHDKRTGKERWYTPRITPARAEQCDAYTTPIFHDAPGGREMIVMGGAQIDGYDPDTGKQLWYLSDLGGNRTITGPTPGKDLVYATVGMRRSLLAVKPGGKGKLDRGSIAWEHSGGTPDTPCPVLAGDVLLIISDNGIAQALDARTGEVHWKERLPGAYRASPILAGGKIYVLNREGLTTVISASKKFEKLAGNQLDDETLSSLAVSDGRIFLRGKKWLYCLGKESGPQGQEKSKWISLFDGKSLKGWKVADKYDFELHGKVEVKEGAIILERGDAQTGVVLAGEFPRENYEVSLEASRLEGTDFFCGLTFPVGKEPCTLIIGGWGGTTVGLSNVDDYSAVENETTNFITFEEKRWYRIRLRVTGENISAWIDEKHLIDLDREGHRFTIWPQQEPVQPFGIATWYTTGALRNIRYRGL